MQLGLNFIGVEKSAQYAQIAQENLQRAFKNKASLFDAVV